MIREELQKIKAFGSDLASHVTLEHILAKEAELGVKLPEALKDLYLTFHEDDPVLTEQNFFVPLSQLEVTERGGAHTTSSAHKMVIFIKWAADGTGDGFLLDDEEIDPLVYRCYGKIKKPSDRFFLMPEGGVLSVFLLWHVGLRQLRRQRLVVQMAGEHFNALWDGTHDDWHQGRCAALADTFEWLLGPHPTHKFDLLGRAQQSPYGFVGITKRSRLLACLSFGRLEIAGCTPEQLDQVITEVGAETWRYVTSSQPKPVRERPLVSILPAIQAVKERGAIAESGVSPEECAQTEVRLGLALPLPIKEIMIHLPKDFSTHFLPLTEMIVENGKVHFFSGEQGVPKYYFKKDSALVYTVGEMGNDVAIDVLDGFLAAELFWQLMCQEKAGMVLAEMTACAKTLLSRRGKLGKFLQPCYAEMTKGCKRSLYHWAEQDVLALYDVTTKTLYLSAASVAPLEQLEKRSGVSFSWL